MKKILTALMLSLTLSSAFADNIFISTEQATIVTSIYPFASTYVTNAGHYRGVAGHEQLKDELIALNDDMQAGLVQQLADVRQPALKEYLNELASDEEQMAHIDASIPVGSKLFKLANAAAASLLAE